MPASRGPLCPTILCIQFSVPQWMRSKAQMATPPAAWAPALNGDCLAQGHSWMTPASHPQELFTHVLYSECEIYLWHRPQRGIIEHMVPTIYNVMRQFEAMVRLVTTTCLRTPSMTAQDRARVVEFWIRVAKVCYGTAPGVHPGVLGAAPLLGQLSGWVPAVCPARSLGPPARGVRTWTHRPRGWDSHPWPLPWVELQSSTQEGCSAGTRCAGLPGCLSP